MTIIFNYIKQCLIFSKYYFDNTYNIYYSNKNENRTETENTYKHNDTIFNSYWLNQYNYEFEQLKKNGLNNYTYFLDK